MSRVFGWAVMAMALAGPAVRAEVVLLVSAGDSLKRYDLAGNDLGNFATVAGGALRGVATYGGKVYVANGTDAKVYEYTSGGTFINSYSTSLSAGSMRGLAIDSSGNFYVANSGNGVVRKFNSAWVSQGDFSNATVRGVAVGPDGLLYAGTASTNVLKWAASTPPSTSSNFATGLANSQGLTFDSTGNLYVANFDNSTVSKFNSSGALQQTFSGGGLNGAVGVAVDESGNLYASSFNGNQIVKYNSAGGYVTSWAAGSAPNYIALVSVPEPGTLLLGGIAAACGGGGVWWRRRRRSSEEVGELA